MRVNAVIATLTLASGCFALSITSYGPEFLPLSRRDQDVPIFKYASYYINERVRDLLSRITIKEKAG
jgi:hypothetical protein